MMNILITAGGTSEPIDNVRSISNTATGRLGSLIADEFALEGDQNIRVFYVFAHNALRPKSKNITCIEIGSVAELQKTVTELMDAYPIDAVIHSMAVSDYRVKSVTTPQRVAERFQNNEDTSIQSETELLNALVETDVREEAGKISSQLGNPIVLLEQTPKILPLFRENAPNAVIVGFKLLSEVSQNELIDTAYRLLVKNGCNYVLANDSARIHRDQHEGHLIDSNKRTQTFTTKQEIAKGIVKTVLKELREKK